MCVRFSKSRVLLLESVESEESTQLRSQVGKEGGGTTSNQTEKRDDSTTNLSDIQSKPWLL